MMKKEGEKRGPRLPSESLDGKERKVKGQGMKRLGGYIKVNGTV